MQVDRDFTLEIGIGKAIDVTAIAAVAATGAITNTI
jgi:hypothetical protein